VETIVATGTWLYDGDVPTTVQVVMLDHDFWHTVGVADGDVAPDEAPVLNDQGHLFYVRHRPGWPNGDSSFWPDTQGFHSSDEAVAAAEAAVPGPVTWQWKPAQHSS
jgi:hypothetical protein